MKMKTENSPRMNYRSECKAWSSGQTLTKMVSSPKMKSEKWSSKVREVTEDKAADALVEPVADVQVDKAVDVQADKVADVQAGKAVDALMEPAANDQIVLVAINSRACPSVLLLRYSLVK